MYFSSSISATAANIFLFFILKPKLNIFYAAIQLIFTVLKNKKYHYTTQDAFRPKIFMIWKALDCGGSPSSRGIYFLVNYLPLRFFIAESKLSREKYAFLKKNIKTVKITIMLIFKDKLYFCFLKLKKSHPGEANFILNFKFFSRKKSV